MMRTLFILVGLGVLVACGTVHGILTDRWTTATKVQEAVARLDAVPRTLGEWDGEDVELPAQEQEAAGGAGYLHRRYVHRQTGVVVGVLLVCGRSGPVAVHTPDVCYTGAGYQLTLPPVQREVEGEGGAEAAAFQMIELENKENATGPGRLRVYWSWSGGARWVAPRYPRLALAHYPVLYKLYVIQDVSRADETRKEESALRFMRILLPELQRSIFNAP